MYTARPEIPSPLCASREYRITVEFKRKIIDDDTRTGFGDLYGRVPAVILSYGEAVATCDKLDFQPFVDRAERLAAFYQSVVSSSIERRARAPHEQFARNRTSLPIQISLPFTSTSSYNLLALRPIEFPPARTLPRNGNDKTGVTSGTATVLRTL